MSSSPLREESRDGVLLLFLAKGRGNALDPAFLRALRDRLRGLKAKPPRGVVLSAEGKVFSAGLDLFALAEFDREQMSDLLDALYETLRELFGFPRPVVAALNGHAIAGGLLLALACDARLMAQGDARLGLNEAALGLPMPAHSIDLLRYSLSRRIVEKLCYGGQLYPAYKALDMGILDELIEASLLLDRAVEWVVDWTSSPQTFAANKARLKATTLAAMDAAKEHDGQWLDQWFAEETQRHLQSARERLGKRDA